MSQRLLGRTETQRRRAAETATLIVARRVLGRALPYRVLDQRSPLVGWSITGRFATPGTWPYVGRVGGLARSRADPPRRGPVRLGLRGPTRSVFGVRTKRVASCATTPMSPSLTSRLRWFRRPVTRAHTRTRRPAPTSCTPTLVCRTARSPRPRLLTPNVGSYRLAYAAPRRLQPVSASTHSFTTVGSRCYS